MEIDDLVAYCGLTCRHCPIYLATQEADKEKQAAMRAQIAELIREHYGTATTDCDGCKTPSGRLYTGCRTCEIRTCAREKGCITCAHCTEYPCGKLQRLFESDPSAKLHLDDIRKRI